MEAKILDDYFQPYVSQEKREKEEVYFTGDNIKDKYNVTPYETALMLENLVRLGILKPTSIIEGSSHDASPPRYKSENGIEPLGRRYIFTILGHAFTHACHPL
jgi:hypothetical protein